MKNDRLKSILGIPYLLFLTIVVVCPVLILLYYAFTNGAGQFSMDNFVLFFTDSKAIGTLIYSAMIAIVTTVVCLLIAYPVAYILAKGDFKRGNVLLMLFVMPMWINFTLRITALKEILTMIEGNLAFHPFLNTVIGMTYDFLPFMILPIYNTIAPGRRRPGPPPWTGRWRSRRQAPRPAAGRPPYPEWSSPGAASPPAAPGGSPAASSSSGRQTPTGRGGWAGHPAGPAPDSGHGLTGCPPAFPG